MHDDFYVYGLVDPETNVPFYIGKGRGGRVRTHIFFVKRGKNSGNQCKEEKIRNILLTGKEPIILFFYRNLTEETAYALETKLIISYGRVGFEPNGILLNKSLYTVLPTNTGRTCFPKGHIPWNKGRRGPTHSAETREKMRLSKIGKPSPMKNRKMSEETKIKIGLANKGKTRSEETKIKIGLGNKGKIVSLETREKQSKAHIGISRPDLSEIQKKRLSDPKILAKHKIMCKMRGGRRPRKEGATTML